jgi:hypothetical protein
MDQARTSAIFDANTQMAFLTKLIVDERKSVIDVSARFEATLVKSDKLKDDDASTVARIVR